MENKFTSSESLQNYLKEQQFDFKVYNHDEAITLETLQKVVKFEKAPYVKNLLFTDKKGYYYIFAKNETKIDPSFWKQLNLKGNKMRLASEDFLKSTLECQKGNVNPFALYNDNEARKISRVLIDQNLQEHEFWSAHPMVCTESLEFKGGDLIKLLEKWERNPQVIDLATPVVEEKKEEKKKPEKKVQEGETLLKVTVKKQEDMSEWYSQTLLKSEMLDYYDVSGCYILRPWAYSIWEKIQQFLDAHIKNDDVDNCYFPMFVTQKALETEKDHVEGFSPEVAWVTKSGQSELQEPIAIRPTSETIMYPAFGKWIRGHRDLPLKINQWSNVVRWEFKHPTPFIRTREFLWQEGHTAHATKQEADDQTYTALEFYRSTYEDLLAVPVIKGIKTETEKFPGGDFTTTVETIIPDNGRSIQCATSHQLGQNFAKMFKVEFEDENCKKQKIWQTSWGLTTRSIGVMIMVHGDDIGLVLPPRIANIQVVIVPIPMKNEELFKKQVEKSHQIAKQLKAAGIRVKVDDRSTYSPGWKYSHWELKGVPIRLELGPKDFEKDEFRAVVRFNKEKFQIKWDGIEQSLKNKLDEIQAGMLVKAKGVLDSKIHEAKVWKDFMVHLNNRNAVYTPWCNREACEENVKQRSGDESKLQGGENENLLTGAAKSLCMPLDQPKLEESDICFACGKKAEKWVLWGRSY